MEIHLKNNAPDFLLGVFCGSPSERYGFSPVPEDDLVEGPDSEEPDGRVEGEAGDDGPAVRDQQLTSSLINQPTLLFSSQCNESK
jgi:hypothetical protein